MIPGATRQYRDYSTAMSAIGGRWHVYRARDGHTLSGVVVAPQEDMLPGSDILVHDVHATSEHTMRVRLAVELARRASAILRLCQARPAS